MNTQNEHIYTLRMSNMTSFTAIKQCVQEV